MALTVNLIGPSPWGFRISGGRDFNKVLTVSKVNRGSKAELASLREGDVILEINGEKATEMLNAEAQNKIKSCRVQLRLLVDRPEPSGPGQTNGIISSEQLVGRFQGAMQEAQDESQNLKERSFSSPASPVTSPYSLANPPNRTEAHSTKSVQLQSRSLLLEEAAGHRTSRTLSQEFSPQAFGSDSVSSRSCTPPGVDSPCSPSDGELSLSPQHSSEQAMQRFDRDSEVFKMIKENKESQAAPRQSSSFRLLQEVLEADEKGVDAWFPGRLCSGPPQPGPSVGGVQRLYTCEKCGSSIATQAVRIAEDRHRHPDCYVCAQCGLNLKMRGHFWVGEEMFCEKHAQEKYRGPGSSYRTPVSSSH